MSEWNVDGFRFAGVHCGIKGNGQLDLGLIVADEAVPCAGVYTTNLVVAAPVILSRKHIAQTHHAQAVVINSGNANACTGAQGMTDAIEMARIAAQVASCTPDKVQVCSTGVIGAPLPMTCVRTGLKGRCGKPLIDSSSQICRCDLYNGYLSENASHDHHDRGSRNTNCRRLERRRDDPPKYGHHAWRGFDKRTIGKRDTDLVVARNLRTNLQCDFRRW